MPDAVGQKNVEVAEAGQKAPKAEEAPVTLLEFGQEVDLVKKSTEDFARKQFDNLSKFNPDAKEQGELRKDAAKGQIDLAEAEAVAKAQAAGAKESVGSQVVGSLVKIADKVKDSMGDVKVDVAGKDSGTASVLYKGAYVGVEDPLGARNVVFGYKYDGKEIQVSYEGSVSAKDGSSTHDLQAGADLAKDVRLSATLRLNTAGTGSDLSVADYEATLGVQLPLGTTVTISKVPDNFITSINLQGNF